MRKNVARTAVICSSMAEILFKRKSAYFIVASRQAFSFLKGRFIALLNTRGLYTVHKL